jgi:hypothetical protein
MNNEARDFAEIVTDLRNGATHKELSVALMEAMAAAKRTGKMATVQLTIKIKPQGDRQVEVVDAIRRTIPEPTRAPTIMFVDDRQGLTRYDVRQMTLDEVKVVARQEESPMVVVDEETGEVLKEVPVQ